MCPQIKKKNVRLKHDRKQATIDKNYQITKQIFPMTSDTGIIRPRIRHNKQVLNF